MDVTGGAPETTELMAPVPLTGAAPGAMPQAQSSIKRDTPQPAPDRAAFITSWCGRIKGAKKHWDKDFKRMREDMDFVFQGADKDWTEFDKYVANIVQQYVRQRVARLYARNPIFTCKRKQRLDFKIWDENPQSIMTAQMQAQADPAFLPLYEQLVADIQEGSTRRQQMDKICKTMELLFMDCVQEQRPNFKKAMKQLIRRVETTGIGWVKIDYQRIMQPRPDEEAQVDDVTHRVAVLDRLRSDKVDEKFNETDRQNEELKQAESVLQAQKDIIVREGLVFSFPRSTSVVVDPRTRSLDGLQGTDWLAEEFLMTTDEVKEIYKIDLGNSFRAYTAKEEDSGQRDMFPGRGGDGYSVQQLVQVWEVYDKKTGMFFVLADGYPDYLRAPAPPPITVETFFPYLALMFNEIEHDKHIYPLSDVRQLRHIQKEYNRAKEALRQHRIASAPLYATGAGQFDEEDQLNLALHNPHDVVVLKGLGEGENVNNKLQMVKKYPIDPNVYQTSDTFQDLTRVVGADDSALGTTSTNVTATDSSLANDTRMSSLSSNTDDLDEFMSELGRLGGQVLLMEMSAAEVTKRVGVGAVWPQLTVSDIMSEIYLTVEAGSSGRPNKAAKGAALERVGNILLSIPGVSPRWLFKQVMQTVDETIDLTDAFVEGQPSILALNKITGTAESTPMVGANAPTEQGPQGANNAPTGPGSRGGAKAPMTAPGTTQNQFVGQT